MTKVTASNTYLIGDLVRSKSGKLYRIVGHVANGYEGIRVDDKGRAYGPYRNLSAKNIMMIARSLMNKLSVTV